MSKKFISFSLGPTGSIVLDPSFPRIAAKAALEVDGALLRVLGKRAPDVQQFVGVTELIPFMQNVIAGALDPASANVFLLTYGKIDPAAGKSHSKSELSEAANRVMKVLEQVAKQEGGPQESRELEYVRDFCRALSDQAAVRQHVPHASNTQGLLRR